MGDAGQGPFGGNSLLFTTVIGVVLLAISAAHIWPKRLVWNASPSVPTGLYWIEYGLPKRGNIVLIELPEPYRTIADQRWYLPENLPALKLPEWSGCLPLKSNEVFLLTDHSKSFDGRYFGPVNDTAIVGIVRPIWTD